MSSFAAHSPLNLGYFRQCRESYILDMSKQKYADLSKTELIQRITALENQKRYGLVWEEEHSVEPFENQAQAGYPALAEIPKNSISANSDQRVHLLIEGENYHALTVLARTYAKAVDVIYIDPPYNTGNNDFRYKDRYVDPEHRYRHSQWLSFMQKRLELARGLLKDTGLFFISIDDNELAQVKLLCDELFGEENYRNSIVVSRVKKNIRERDLVKSLNFGHGTVIFYGRTNQASIQIPTRFHPKKERWHSFDAPGIRRTMEYGLFGQKPPAGRHWMYTEERASELIANGLLRPNSNTGKPEYFLKPSNHTMLDTNWMDIQEGDSSWITNGGKNPELIKRILRMHPDKNAVVLDFFAGSGATAQAVVELNAEDGGDRQFILCTNNENNICSDVCFPRIRKLGCSLRYNRTAFEPAEDENAG